MKHFRPSEFGDGFKLMDPLLLETLDALREYIGHPIHIHSAYRAGDPGQHGKGRAVDISTTGIRPWELWLAASRFPAIRGLGAYPYWSRPGIHIDTRDAPIRALWWRDEGGVYRALDYLGLDALAEAA